MPKQGCVTHKLTTFMQIRSDYLDLFEGDHCSAILLWIFEYQTDHEIGRLELAKEDGPPWIKISVDQLEGEFLGLFRESAIKDRLALFREHQLIQVESGKGGRASRYLLDCNLVSELLQSRKHITVDPDRPEAAVRPQQKSEPEAAAEVAGRPHIREEEVRSKNNTPVAPSSGENLSETEQSLDLDDDVITFVQNAYRRGNRRAKLDNLRSKSNERLCEQIRQSEQEYGKEVWRSALFRYLADTSDWLAKQKWPPRVFLSQVGKYGYGHGALVPRPAVANASPTPNGLPAPSVQPAVCNARETANDIAAKWNQLVPSAPVEVPLYHTTVSRVEALLKVQEFADNFATIAQKIEKIRQARGDDADWMVFPWLIQKPKNGEVENWQKLLAGRFNYMANKRKSKGRDSPGDVVARVLAASQERKERGIH